ncbi:multiple sugar transport system substrate-binding protein [Paenibacillus cellulosilyticus]|uniref:Multiple sugar transport system substrate-binding protein n=1 Tax=Paenibacillus cellulosilyticus TaxID=375489 RepID=A0A2V2YII6_9BACL|nr:extracellular solute-binding protein [Paenibacillus cellulosilyticus]PWV87840.1 multiple sugar transport system substrate-binding protein [Paenibacillus cellulosilyticus]QKS43122.1 extracellular solute-binding protein [Paenibacillus cellulosilyticus]
MEKRLWMKRAAATTVALTMLVPLMAACSKGEKDSSTEKRVLRIGTLYGGKDNEPWSRQQYTDTFEFTHPNIELEIVGAINNDDQRFQTYDPNNQQKQPDTYEELKKMLTGQNPVDVVVIDYSQLKRLVQDNLLQQLDPLIAQDKFDLTDYVPTVLDGIKQVGDNNLYALTPTFSASALFYNKKLFQDAGVTPPTDGMFWPDIVDLARRVSKGEGKDRKFGLSFNRWPGSNGIYDVQNYASTLQLKVWDDKGEKMLVNTPGWENALNVVAGLYKDDIVPDSDDVQKMNEGKEQTGEYNPVDNDWFLSGRVAMTISDFSYVNELTLAKDNAAKIKDFTPVDWDVVTVPQHQEAAGVGGSIYYSQLMGINAKAQNADDAWEFIKFTNSPEVAKLKSRSQYELSSRKSFIKASESTTPFNIAAFYTLKPIPPSSTDTDKVYREKPGIWEAQNAGSEVFTEVVKGTKTAKEALAEWETKGNAVLEKLKTNPNGGDGGGTIDVKPLAEAAGEATSSTDSATVTVEE